MEDSRVPLCFASSIKGSSPTRKRNINFPNGTLAALKDSSDAVSPNLNYFRPAPPALDALTRRALFPTTTRSVPVIANTVVLAEGVLRTLTAWTLVSMAAVMTMAVAMMTMVADPVIIPSANNASNTEEGRRVLTTRVPGAPMLV